VQVDVEQDTNDELEQNISGAQHNDWNKYDQYTRQSQDFDG